MIDLVTGTFISRVLGFLRELVTAAYYGTGRGMDLFVIAFTIPTFFRHFLGEDVVERAFMPPFKKLISQGKHAAAWRLLSASFNMMILALNVFMMICYLIAPLIVRFIAPGLEQQYFSQAIHMTYWILPYMLLIGLAAFVGGVLNFFEMNKIYSIAPAFMSVGVVIGVHYFQKSLGIYALAAGFLLGGLLELLVQLPFLFVKQIRKDTSARYYFKMDLREREFRVVGRESGFILLKSMLDKSAEIVDRILASFLIAGSLSSLWFAQRLIQLPVAIVGLAISRSLIPYLTEKRALTQEKDFINGIRLGIQMNFILILPVVTIMVVMSEPLIGFVYQRGSFDAESTHLTSIAFIGYSVGLLGISLNTFFARIFSIFQKNKMPFYVTLGTVTLNIILDFILVRTPLKHGGIALAASIAFSINSLILFVNLYRELSGQLSIRAIVKEFTILFVYCALAGLLGHIAYQNAFQPLVHDIFSSDFLRHFISLIVIGFIISALFMIQIILLGPEELKIRLFSFKKLKK